MKLWPVVSVVLLNYEMSVSIYFKGWNMMAISFKFFSLFRSFLTRPHCNFVISLNYEIVIIDVCFFHSFNVWFFKFVTLPYPYPGRIKFDIISMSNNLIFPFSFLFFFFFSSFSLRSVTRSKSVVNCQFILPNWIWLACRG